MHDYLNTIVANKQQEIVQLQHLVAAETNHPITAILKGEADIRPLKSFRQALTRLPWAVIAEIKRRSPSKAHLADIVDPIALAQLYKQGGAAAISVLTDYSGFGGSLQDLTAVAQSLADSPIPVLRKDFILEEIQIAESILAGADAVLLIVAILKERTIDLLAAARRMNIDAIVEVHSAAELDLALKSGADIIGVNNRNLSSFELDVNCSRELIQHIPSSIIKIAESGIANPKIGAELLNLGYNALLIGESLVKSSQPELFIHELQQMALALQSC